MSLALSQMWSRRAYLGSRRTKQFAHLQDSASSRWHPTIARALCHGRADGLPI